jgi:hypothetical protein
MTPPPVLITLTKKASPGDGPVEVIYTIHAKNDPIRNVYNITMWDTLPAQVQFEEPISGPIPVVAGQYLFWDWGGGVVDPGQELVVAFKARILSRQPDTLFVNTAASDYNDDYYAAIRHPIVYSNQAFYPEGRTAVYPNPFNPGSASSGNLKFVNMPLNSVVTIYSLSGEAVRTISTESTNAYWDAKNSEGNKVSAGIYFYVIRNLSGGYLLRGKIYLLRN